MKDTTKKKNPRSGFMVPEVYQQYLKKRGYTSEQEIYEFLNPKLEDLPKPAKMLNLESAATLVVDFIVRKKQILIWGDYDVDGTTGTALLVNFLRELNADVSWYIPDRLKEGYGLNSKWFTNPGNKSISTDFLLITVDCGISNAREIKTVQEMGGTVIVTDHHSIPEHSLPSCLILNPSQKNCGFYGHQLAGVGVAFYLAAGIRASMSVRAPASAAQNINLKQYLAFVAIGTIADVVELTTTNRILVRGGFEALASLKLVGLKALLSSCDISGKVMSSEDVGYLIGPRINAAGRLGNSKIVVELLTEKDRKIAEMLADKLTNLNSQRRDISERNLETALSTLSVARTKENACALVKGDLHQGVAGIVASKLVDMFNVPAIVFATKLQEDGSVHYIGSARSVDGVSIVELLQFCSKLIEKFGGHSMAAGLTVAESNMKMFEQEFESKARKTMKKRVIQPKVPYDILCPVGLTMNEDHLKCFSLLEPFGPANAQPVFHDPEVLIVDSKSVGRGADHLQVTIRGKQVNYKGIGFGLGPRQSEIQGLPQRKMTYTPTMNRFRGNVSWQVRVIDI